MTDQPTMEAENAIPLDGLAAGVDYLEAIVVFLGEMTYASWVRPSAPLSASAMGRAYAEALAACTTASRRIEASASPTTARRASVTIEDDRHTVVVEAIRSFGVAVVFERQAPLGLARAHTHKIVRTLEHELPYGDVTGVRVNAPPAAVAVVPSPSMAPTVGVPPVLPPPRAQSTDDIEERGPDTTDSRPAPNAQRFHAVDRAESIEAPPVSGPNPEKPAIVIPVDAVIGGHRSSPSSEPSSGAPPSPTWGSDPAPPPRVPSVPPAAIDPPALVSRESAPTASGPIASTRTRALGIVRYVESTSPEPHIAVLRLALRSGLGLDRIRDVERLNDEQLLLLETAAEEMLGLERGEVHRRVEEGGIADRLS